MSRSKAVVCSVRTAALALAVVAFSLGAAPVAQAQAYPARPVKFVAPIAPGGLTDILARLLGQRLSVRLGQPVVVENRPGAGLIVGMEYTKNSAADGYTIVIASQGAMSVNASIYKKLPYDTLRDFVPITQVVNFPVVLVVGPNFPAHNVKEFTDLARAKPGSLTYGSAGNATISHLGMELFKRSTGTDVTHVPFKGESPAMNEVMGDRVSGLMATFSVALPLIRSGKVRALGVASTERSAVAPDLPTLSESGLLQFNVTGWFGVLAPAGTPRPIVERLHRELTAVLAEPEVRDRLLGMGVEPVGSASPEAFGGWIRAEAERWKQIVEGAGIKAD